MRSLAGVPPVGPPDLGFKEGSGFRGSERRCMDCGVSFGSLGQGIFKIEFQDLGDWLVARGSTCARIV